jgi:hypothetical protein
MKYGFARVSTDDQTTPLQRVALTKARMQNHFQGREPVRNHDRAPPAPLSEEAGKTATRLISLEAGPIRSQLAQP